MLNLRTMVKDVRDLPQMNLKTKIVELLEIKVVI